MLNPYGSHTPLLRDQRSSVFACFCLVGVFNVDKLGDILMLNMPVIINKLLCNKSTCFSVFPADVDKVPTSEDRFERDH